MFLAALGFVLAFHQTPASLSPAVVTGVPLAPAPDQVIVTVNGSSIRARDIEPFLWDWRGEEVAQDLVTYHLIKEAAQKAGVTVDPAEIDQAIVAEIKTMQTRMAPGGDVQKVLRSQGYPKSRMYMKVHTDLLLNRIVLKSFSPGDFVKVSALVFSPKSASGSDVSDAIARAQAAYDRLQKGGDWTKELQASDDPAALKNLNGMLGWRSVAAFPQPTQVELREGKLGKITKPAQAGGAIQVFRIEATGASTNGPEIEELRKEYVASERQKLVSQIQSSAKIVHVFAGVPKPNR